MDRMRGRMVLPGLLILLLLITAASVFALVCNYRSSYKAINLLRIDPLELNNVRQDDLEAALRDSDIWLIGDSRMRRWNKDLLRSSSEIVNLGVEGQTSSQILYRFRSYLGTATPSLVVLEVGINDLKIIGLDHKMAGSITQQYFRNIEQIIELCRTRNIRLILIDIFHVGKIELSRRLVWNNAVYKAIDEANLRLDSYCDDVTVYCFDANAILSDDGMTVRPEYREDFLHINKRGYEALSISLEELINKLINQQ